MVLYRRNLVPGASYFFTAALRDRSSDALVRHVDLLTAALRKVREARPFTIDAIVVLPEHLHCIWTLPRDDGDYPGRWRAVKARFTQVLRPAKSLWQPRYWEHTLRDEEDVARHIDYIHFNPVKHGWVKRAADWPHSSFHRFVARGMYPADWGLAGDAEVEAGEPL